MKKFALLSFTLLLSINASAGLNFFGSSKKKLNQEVLEDVKRNNQLDQFRIYLDKPITIKFMNNDRPDHLTIENTKKGKIIGDEVRYQDEYKKNKKGEFTHSPSTEHILYVTFDPKCLVKKCALKFSREIDNYELNEVPMKQARITYGTYSYEEQKATILFDKDELEELIRTKHYAQGFE